MPPIPQTRIELAKYIDHTVLKPETSAADVNRLCDEARQYSVAAVCVNPVWVTRCVERLAGSGIGVASVAGFPLGASLPETKADEARRGVEQGAGEIDMVVNVAALRAEEAGVVTHDIAAVVQAVKKVQEFALVKVILETGALDEQQIILGCRCAADAHADYVKTSTGFHATGGATVEAVRLMREHAGRMKVKASGGIRDLPTAQAMIEAGASRLGMSASVAILESLPA